MRDKLHSSRRSNAHKLLRNERPTPMPPPPQKRKQLHSAQPPKSVVDKQSTKRRGLLLPLPKLRDWRKNEHCWLLLRRRLLDEQPNAELQCFV
jgi:hypothetical protein